MFQLSDLFQVKHNHRSMFTPHSFGMEICKKCHAYGPRIRDYHIIHYVVSGKGLLEINGQRFEIEKNTAFLIPAGVKASYEADDKCPWKYCWTGFFAEPEDIALILPQSSCGFLYMHVNTQNIWDITLRLLRRMPFYDDFSEKEFFTGNYHLGLNSDCSLSFAMSSALYEILSCLPVQTKNQTSATEEIVHVREYLDLYYTKPIRIAEIARIFAMHPTYLTAVFRKEYQVSPKEYIMKKRIETACKLLHTTSLPVRQIASTVGYENQLEFTQIFKKHTGKSPTEYRH